MIPATAFLFGAFSFRTATTNLKRSSHLKMSSSTSQSQPTSIRIFCYGDSLTAGTSPPMDRLFPYGPSLERELNKMYSESSNTSVVVRWRGLPGWTASTMVEYLDDSSVGLRSAVNGISNPSLSLVIILAGTNDIGMLTSSMSSANVDVEKAVDPILRLHKACLESNNDNDPAKEDERIQLQTLAVGIPGSAWQQMNSEARKLCRDMNDVLEGFASSYDSNEGGRISFTNFPFDYAQSDSKWSSDGLHLSPEGYEVLGVELAKSVKDILDSS